MVYVVSNVKCKMVLIKGFKYSQGKNIFVLAVAIKWSYFVLIFICFLEKAMLSLRKLKSIIEVLFATAFSKWTVLCIGYAGKSRDLHELYHYCTTTDNF